MIQHEHPKHFRDNSSTPEVDRISDKGDYILYYRAQPVMQFLSYLRVLVLGAPLLLTVAHAYSVTAYAGGLCNLENPNQGALTVSGYLTSTATFRACFQLPFQGNSISVSGCGTNGTVRAFTDVNCATPAAPPPIQASGVLCEENTPLRSFTVVGC